MDRMKCRSLATASALFLLLVVPLSRAITHHFVENFTTTDYRHGAYTNAWWDTATGELKLRSFELSVVGSYDTPGDARAVAVDGDFAFVADGGEGLLILDISSPTPVLIQSIDTPGTAWGIAVAGDHAYVADLATGLRVIDVSDPWSPSAVGAYDTPGFAYDVRLAGDYAFVADGTSGGLRVVDISNPASPASAGFYDTPGEAIAIDLAGDYAYIADRGAGLTILDISDPTTPMLADSYDTPGDCWGVAVSGDHVFLGDALQGVVVLDVSDPTDVDYVTTVDPSGSHRRLFVTGDYLYSAAYGHLQAIDVSDPTLPFVAGSYSAMNLATTVVVDGEYAYVADGAAGGLRVVEVADAFQPFRIGGLEPDGRAESVFCDGDLAYVAESSGGSLRIVDITYADGPAEIGSYGRSGYDVFVSGDRAFLATTSSGLVIVDVADPSNPLELGSYYSSEPAYGVFVSGNYAFVAFNYGGLYVIDVSDPTSPSQIGYYDTPDRAKDVVVRGDLAFVADGGSGLQIIDVTNPASPSFTGGCDTPGFAEEVAVAGEYAYVADSGQGLAVIDISNPAAPSLVDQLATSAWAVSVALSGNWAFVGTGHSVERVSIETPDSPVLIDSAPIESYARGLCPTGDFVLVADTDDGVDVMRVFHRRFTNANRARSLPINDTGDTIVRVSLTTAQFDSIRWEVSANGGGDFHDITPGEWKRVTPGSSLIWRSAHLPVLGTNPKCSQLAADWLFEFPVMGPAVDVPDDNGGWVRLTVTRSGYDFSDEPQYPVEEYIVWRRPQDIGTGIETSSGLSGSPLSDAAGFVTGALDAHPSKFPPGDWEAVDTVPALQQQQYTIYAPTASDSGEAGAEPSVFVISAHTTDPMVWAVSAPESGFSRDNTPPSVPTGIEVKYNTGKGNHLSWDDCPDADFYRFWIYRGDTEDFPVAPGVPVHVTTCTDWYDPEYDGWPVFYKIAAVDRAGNEGPAASAGQVSGIGEGAVPERFALHHNAPNPLSAVTMIPYDVPPEGGDVSIRIYDVAGRLVRTLVDGVKPPGRWSASWDGKSDGGARTASGVYFCRMTAPGYTMTRKMMLVR